MRKVAIILAVCLVSACNTEVEMERISANAENESAGSAGGESDGEMAALSFYSRKIAAEGQVLAPPVLLRLSGTLKARRGCLVVANESGDHALVFEDGAASYDPQRRVLTSGAMAIALGDTVSVGGPFNQPSDDFDPDAVAKRCGVGQIWLVSGTDMKSKP